MIPRKPTYGRILIGLAAVCSVSASAHPMGNFSINHYACIHIEQRKISIKYLLDYAEIPTVSERSEIDKAAVTGAIRHSSAGTPDAQQAPYLQETAVRLGKGLKLTVNGADLACAVVPVALTFQAGAAGLQTMRLELNVSADFRHELTNSPSSIVYSDSNYENRTGWKEIVLAPGSGVGLVKSDASTADRSRELRFYPSDPTLAPPLQLEAHVTVFSMQPGSGEISTRAIQPTVQSAFTSTTKRSSTTPRDAFTESIAHRKLTLRLIFVSMLIAFGLGALHALSPGHGKAMMGAYLVGAQGAPVHAVILGIVVTLTHTIGVFVLGISMLAASQYIVAERLYTALSAASGLTIAGMGLALFRQRWTILHRRAGFEYCDEPLDMLDGSGVPIETAFSKSRGPLSVRSLVALGITGGILPCPSALVVILSAFALHRIALGMALVLAFSGGMAVVLTAIGLAVVYSKGYVEKTAMSRRWVERLPIASAAFVTVAGVLLFVGAVYRGGN